MSSRSLQDQTGTADQSLLLSKLQHPHLKPDLVLRPRLFTRLDEGLQKKLIVLSAPAGFGKTTLLASWLESSSLPSVWLTLDEDENDPARFLRYLVAAFQQLDSAFDDTVLELLSSPQPALHKAALTALLNQVEALQTDSILVLDDFHLIGNPEIYQALDYILGYLPPGLHLVLSSRADPPLNLSRLRGQGEILDLRLADLRFTDDEVRDFFSRVKGLQFPEQDILKLAHRTEGWISGLQMATISLLGKEDSSSFVASFSGSNRYIMDYLIEEVLNQQTSDRQQFLLETSILDRLTGDLCDRVLERNGSQQLLQELEKENLFLIPLDEQRQWYRYHQLFKDLLLHRITLKDPDQIPDIQSRASHWFAENGWIESAIDYALECGDFQRAVEMISIEAEITLMRSEVNTFQSWIDRLPDKLLKTDPELVYLQAWAMIIRGTELDAALKMMNDLTLENQTQIKRINVLKAFCQVTRGEFAAASLTAQQALNTLEESDHYFRGLAAWISSINAALQMDISNSFAVLQGLYYTRELQGAPMIRVIMLSQMARIQAHLGNFQQARELYTEALEAGTDRQGNWIPIAGEPLMGLGDMYRELNQLDQAYDCIMSGIELTRQWRKAAAIEGYLFLSRVKQLQGDWSGANLSIDKARRIAVEFDVMDMDDRIVAMWQARLWCFEGKHDRVDEWLKNYPVQKSIEDVDWNQDFNIDSYLLLREKMVLARYYILQESYEKALELMCRLRKIYQDYNRVDLLIEIDLLTALVHSRLGEKSQSQQSLTQAFQLGKKGGFVGLFLECGSELAKLLADYQGEFPDYAFLPKLMAAFLDKEPGQSTAQPLLDPLSEREQDVLKLLPSNLTTPEIADQMILSVNTIRTHIKNIYQKLGVHKRYEAVRKAEELELIQ